MSSLSVYSVYDSKVEAFMQPFFMKTDGEALRSWMDIVNEKSSVFAKHPEDFTLMKLGEYDERSGKFSNEATPRSLGIALQFVRQEAATPQVSRERVPASMVNGAGSFSDSDRQADFLKM